MPLDSLIKGGVPSPLISMDSLSLLSSVTEQTSSCEFIVTETTLSWTLILTSQYVYLDMPLF